MTNRWRTFFLLAGLLLGGFFSSYAAETAKGTVFHDRNQNGRRDAEEEGVPGVCVSNGRDVVQTNREGQWALPVDDDAILFVIKPAQWAVPVNDLQLPQFYYIHKPTGSPQLAVPGVSPTGPLPEAIDFPLYKREESGRFQILLFGDTQARGMREVNFITHDVVEELVGADVAFGISLGDIVADDAALFAPISASIAQIGVPWYNVFGNHDTNRDAPSDATSDETFERVFGPTTYAFEYGEVVFIALDSVIAKPEGGYDRGFTDEQVAFAGNYLATVPEDRLVVLLMHVPIVACRNRDEMLALIAGRPHTFSVSAHAHEQAHLFLRKEQGWHGAPPHHHLVHATVCGSWWCGTFDELGIPHATMNDGAPNGYSYLTFDGNEYRIRFKAARRPADYQMNIYLPDDVERAEAAQTEILVNVFAGSERSTVEMRFGKKGKWVPLEQTRTIDPQCLRMHNQNPYLNEEVFGWKMDYPSETSHMWRGLLPESPPPGTHLVTVRHTDMFGQVWTAHRIVRIH